jgi:hypothetical protein
MLTFILIYHHSYDEIIAAAKMQYKDFFNDKLFKEQLSFFEDINYDEEVEFIGNEIPQDEIEKFLINISTEKF